MQPSSSTLAIFDSGIGGLSLVRYLEEQVPGVDYQYFADTAFLPYGDKTVTQICDRVEQVLDLLIQRGVSALVVACNTADAVAIPRLLARCPLPIFRLIDLASRVAVQQSRRGRVGVLATSLTVASGAYPEALFREGARWAHSVACPKLVPLIEESPDSPELEVALREYLEPLMRQKMDTLILGCTHFALIRPLIQRMVGPDVRLVDPALSTGEAVVRWLEGRQGRSRRHFVVSGDPEAFAERAARTLPWLSQPCYSETLAPEPEVGWLARGAQGIPAAERSRQAVVRPARLSSIAL